MKIKVSRITADGLALTEEIPVKELDLDAEVVLLRSPVRVTAEISRITNAVSVSLELNARLFYRCSRCLSEFPVDITKDFNFNYTVDSPDEIIDLTPDIRQEMILDYPIKPLCTPECKGLCARCGKNLNEGGCSCGST